MKPLKIGLLSSGRDEDARELLASVVEGMERRGLSVCYLFVNRERGDQPESDRFLDEAEGLGLKVVAISSPKFQPDLKRRDESAWNRAFHAEALKRLAPLRKPGPVVDLALGYIMVVKSPEFLEALDILNLHPSPLLSPGGGETRSPLPLAPDGARGLALRASPPSGGRRKWPPANGVRGSPPSTGPPPSPQPLQAGAEIPGHWTGVMWEHLRRRSEFAGAMLHRMTPELDKGPCATHCRVPLRGPEFDPLWKQFDEDRGHGLTVADLQKRFPDWRYPVGSYPLFTAIRKAQFAREVPLTLVTLERFVRGELAFKGGALVDSKGKPRGPEDVTEEVEALLR